VGPNEVCPDAPPFVAWAEPVPLDALLETIRTTANAAATTAPTRTMISGRRYEPVLLLWGSVVSNMIGSLVKTRHGCLVRHGYEPRPPPSRTEKFWISGSAGERA
jgi:hypothetical protein